MDKAILLYFQENAHQLFRGKALLKRELEEVREFNGQHGKPCWAYVGRDVFDLSGEFFPSGSTVQFVESRLGLQV